MRVRGPNPISQSSAVPSRPLFKGTGSKVGIGLLGALRSEETSSCCPVSLHASEVPAPNRGRYTQLTVPP